MRITKVHIEHFRSIKKLTFFPEPYCVLIGENNAGKTNILRALNLVIGDKWPTENSFTEKDFHNEDTTKDIVIQVMFDNHFPVTDGPGNALAAYGIELRCAMDASFLSGKEELIVTMHYLLKEGAIATFREGKKPRVNRGDRDKVPLSYVDVFREYDKQSVTNRNSLLKRLLDEVNTDFLNNQTADIPITMPDGETLLMSRKDAFEYTIQEAYKHLRTPEFEQIEQLLGQNVLEQMGMSPPESDVRLHFEGYDPAHLYRTLQLFIDQMGISTSASEVGAGMQSAIVVGILRTYDALKKRGAIFAIEEPEAFLHPQKARYFESVLQNLAASGNQVIVTTHSPIFVQVYQPESIIHVCRNTEQGTYTVQKSIKDIEPNEKRALKLLTEFDTERNELFFAKKVVLVEGNTEKAALPFAFRAYQVDVNREGISIVECGGKAQLLTFIKVVKAFNIPYIVLADDDTEELDTSSSEDEQRKQTEKIRQNADLNEKLNKLCDSGRLFWMVPDFEGELNLPRDKSKKVKQALNVFADLKKEQLPECIRKPIEALLSLSADVGQCMIEEQSFNTQALETFAATTDTV